MLTSPCQLIQTSFFFDTNRFLPGICLPPFRINTCVRPLDPDPPSSSLTTFLTPPSVPFSSLPHFLLRSLPTASLGAPPADGTRLQGKSSFFLPVLMPSLCHNFLPLHFLFDWKSFLSNISSQYCGRTLLLLPFFSVSFLTGSISLLAS